MCIKKGVVQQGRETQLSMGYVHIKKRVVQQGRVTQLSICYVHVKKGGTAREKVVESLCGGSRSVLRGGESKMESLGKRSGRLRMPTAAARDVVTERS